MANLFEKFRFIVPIALVTLLAACSSSPRHRDLLAESGPVDPPAFLVGPVGILFTNSTGFMAKTALLASGLGRPSSPIAGELLGQGSELTYVPGGKSDRSFLWNVATGRGYVLSGQLQGYAPAAMPGPLPAVQLVPAPQETSPESVNGHPSSRETFQATLADGTLENFTVWRATDLNGLPVRIQEKSGPNPFLLDLTDIELRPPPKEIFQPPAGFTAYGSPQALKDEIINRLHPAHEDDYSPLQPIAPTRGAPATPGSIGPY